MAWTAPRTWTDGELVTAAIMNPHIRDNLNAVLHLVVRKPADESTSTTTIQADDHLILPVGVSEIWHYKFVFLVVSASTTDFQLRFNAPTGANLAGVALSVDSTTLQAKDFASTSFPTGATTFNTTGTTSNTITTEGVIVNGGTGGNLVAEWAGNAAATCTVKANSTLWGMKLA